MFVCVRYWCRQFISESGKIQYNTTQHDYKYHEISYTTDEQTKYTNEKKRWMTKSSRKLKCPVLEYQNCVLAEMREIDQNNKCCDSRKFRLLVYRALIRWVIRTRCIITPEHLYIFSRTQKHKIFLSFCDMQNTI